MPPLARVLLIGLDGAEPALVERWMDAGLMPALSSLRRRGAYLPCASTTPPATFPAWTTCVTGVNPGRHGIFDFTELKTGEYGLRFTGAGRRRAPAIWKVLSDQGRRVCVLGVPATYPPEPVNGIMVSGFDSPVCTSVDRSFVHPAGEYEHVREWTFADFQESSIGPGWHDVALPKLLHAIETKERIAAQLLRREPWDFTMIVFGESDTVAHHFWMFHDPNSPRHRPGHADAIQRVYERLDAAVAALIDAAGDDVSVGIVSDHGFGGSGTGVVHLNNRLAETGHLSFVLDRDSALKKAALTFTPPEWRGPLFRRFRDLAARAEGQSRFGGIDWANTRAWSEELNYFPSIRINLKGREAKGVVEPTDYTSYCRDLCAELEAWGPIRKAWMREELYSGDCVERAPDIVLELALEAEYSHSCLRARGGPSFRRLRPEEHVGGKERGMNGNHRPLGVFLWSTPLNAAACSLLDVAPTVYDALGVTGPAMDGHSLLGGGEAVAAVAAPAEDRVYTPEQEAVIEQRLRDLGYFE